MYSNNNKKIRCTPKVANSATQKNEKGIYCVQQLFACFSCCIYNYLHSIYTILGIIHGLKVYRVREGKNT